jgi:metallo-beta-lactamase family protein
MKLTFHGATKTVTGSQHLLEVNGYKILLDCGLFQGKRKEAFELNRQGFVDPQTLDALVLSHAHIDHSGNIPSLVRKGFNKTILSTSATRDLCAIMLLDSAYIQERDISYVNKKRLRQNKTPFEPLYQTEDVLNTLQYFVGISYKRKYKLFEDIFVTFYDAGHILGSAIVVLQILDHDTQQEVELVFTGDIGRAGIPIIRDPAIIQGADILITESTYGDRLHPSYPEMEKELKRIIHETLAQKGVLLIPAFAVGRTQQVVYTLHKLYTQGEIPEIPIYVDSPLATRATEIYRMHPELYDKELLSFLLSDDDQNPFAFPPLHYTNSVIESKKLNQLENFAIIISASGMMENGRILHHLARRISDPRNTILVTGWQAPATLGRYIVEGKSPLKIFGEEYPLKAKVEVLQGLSAHADKEGLSHWIQAFHKRPRKIFVVHGEEQASEHFAKHLREELQYPEVFIPNPHESFTF